jgi:hypothetical protein
LNCMQLIMIDVGQVMLRVEEIRSMALSSPVDLSMMFHSITKSIVSRAALGTKRKHAREFIKATRALVGLVSGFNLPDLFPSRTTVLASLTGMTRSLEDNHKTVDTILEEIIDERDDKIKIGAKEVDEKTSSTCSSACRTKVALASTSPTASSRPSYWYLIN